MRQYQAAEISQLDAVIHVAEADEDDAGTISPAQLEEFLDWHLYDRSAARLVVVSNNPIYSGNHISVLSVSGNTYSVKVAAAGYSNTYAAIDEKILAGVTIGQKIRLYNTANSIHWEGEVSGEAELDEDGVYSFDVSFPSRTGTINIGNVVTIYFGFATSGALDQVANAQFDLLWRYVNDFSEGAGSSNTNRNLISGKDFRDYSIIVFWVAFNNSESAGIFGSVSREIWQTISAGIGSESDGHIYVYTRTDYLSFRYINSTRFRITEGALRLRAVYGLRAP